VVRPLLLLDVDGVVNPFGGACPPGYAEHDLFPGEEPVRVNVAHGRWIAELLTRFDVAWATGWNDEANQVLAPLLAMPALPVIPMPGKPFLARDKVPPIAAYADGRAAAWIDDAFIPEAHAWAAGRAASTLLIPADPAVGLTRAHVDLMLGWAQNGDPGVAGPPPGATIEP
jgi:hypothetical protein